MNHKFYIPQRAAVCDYHLISAEWNELVESPYRFHMYSRKMIEEMFSLCTSGKKIETESDAMSEKEIKKATGLTQTQFNTIL